MDFSSVTAVGAHIKAWVKVDNLEALKTSGFEKKDYWSSKHLYYFDCKSKMLGAINTVLYEKMDAKGDVIESSSQKFEPKLLSDVVPDTIGETLAQVACGTSAERAKLKAQNKAADLESQKQLAKYRSEAAARRAAQEAEQPPK